MKCNRDCVSIDGCKVKIMYFIKRLSPLLLLLLSACIMVNPTAQPSRAHTSAQTNATNNVGNISPVKTNETYRLADSHWVDVAKIHTEADRLGKQVIDGNLTKVQAAQYLNRYRLSLVGSNPVDDNVYEVYQRAAVDSQRGAIDSAQSKLLVENVLKGWQQRWNNMTVKPKNPAFTNFLMEVMDLEPLK